jgi:hypothetical protein
MNASRGNKFRFTTSMRIKAFTVCPPLVCATRSIASMRDRFALFVVILFLSGAPTIVHAANESAPKGFQFVDLSSLAGSFAEFADGKPVAALPKGTQTYGNVPFQIGSPIAVTGLEAARGGELFPKELTGIKIGAKARRIHLLHATLFPEKDGTPIAKIIFHYENGSEESIRLGYGVHTRAWTMPRIEKRDELVDANSRLAWSETEDRRGTGLRLFQTALENPKPAETITSIDIVSLFSRAAPLIFGMSLETAETTSVAKTTVASRKALRDLQEFKDDAYRRDMTARITDGETGQPVSNALATLSIADDKQSIYFGQTRTDAKGVCRFAYPPQQMVGFTLWVHAPDRMPALISESVTNSSKFAGEYSAVLKRGTTIGGLVKDAAGKPVPGAEVVIHRVLRSGSKHYARTDYDNALTGSDGKWKSSSLPPDLTGLTFQVFHPDFRGASYATEGYAAPPTNTSSSSSSSSSSTSVSYRRLDDGTLVPITTTRRTTNARGAGGIALVKTNALLERTAEFTVQPAVLLEGTLADTANKPIPDADLIMQRPNDRKHLRTDAQGRFRARVGEPGDVGIVVLRQGFSPYWTNIIASTNLTPLAIRLSPPRVVQGFVRERNQRPVAGARVKLDEWNGFADLLRWQTVTDAEGKFTWTGAPPDRVTLFVSKTNYSNSRSSFSSLTPNTILNISRPYGVYGRAYDAETKQPIDLFTVIPGRKYSSSDTRINWDRSDATMGRNGEYSLRMSSYYFQPEGRVLIEAPGYEPQISPPFQNYDAYTNDFVLKKGKGISGFVKLPDGSPAGNAALVLLEKGDTASLDVSGSVRGSGAGDMARADARGRFEFSPKLNPDRVFVSHEQGFAEAKVADVLKTNSIVLQKWSSIKGTVRVGEKIDPEQSVRLQSASMNFNSEERPSYMYVSLRGDLDADGNFSFDRVPPGEYRVAVEYRLRENNNNGEQALSHGLPVMAKAGGLTNLVLGGTGRRIVGRVNISGGEQGDVDWRRDVHQLTLVLSNQPRNTMSFTPDGQRIFISNFSDGMQITPQTPEAMIEAQRAQRNYVLLFDTNGNFHADHIPPGKYQLTIAVTDPEDEYYNRRYIGNAMKEITVPNESNAKVNAPLDIGAVDLTIRPRVKVGRVVPSFDLKMADGKTNRLSNLRGKYVLLHFWGRSLGYNSTDFSVLRELQSTYGGPNGKLAIIGCNLDPEEQRSSLDQFMRQNSMNWPQSYLGNWSQTPIPGMFGLQGNSAAILIDPQGKLASAQLRSTSIRSAVQNALNSGGLE